MALDKKVFKTRALTASVFAAVMLLGLLGNKYLFFLLLAVIHLGCWVEYLKISQIIYRIKISTVNKVVFIFFGFVIFFTLGMPYKFYDTGRLIYGISLTSHTIIWLIIIVWLFIFFKTDKAIPAAAKPMMALGFVYISASIGLFLSLKQYIYSDVFAIDNFIATAIPCAVIFSIWINDTMAYLVGSFIGKTPFSKISPKKTWEGTAGGAILCVLTIAVLGVVIPAAQNIAVQHWIVIAAICAVFGTLGDLLESKLKRKANIKDSGNFMPGHGGFLDRFDSLLLAAPIVWVYVRFYL